MPKRPESAESLHIEYQPLVNLSDTARAFDGVQYYGEAAVDIIAVQGLGSWYDWAWSVQVSKTGPRYSWLRHSISGSLPHARVVAFDYNTDWYGDPNRVSLEECAARLLRSVILDRTHIGRGRMCQNRSRRPIIFIGHSFGGLVIKQSLVLAGQTSPKDDNYEDHRAYLNAVTSIMFLGTPHSGSSFLSFAKWKIRAGKIFGASSEDKLLKDLELDSKRLQKLQAEFELVQGRPEMVSLKVFCYYETKDVREGPIKAGLVVTEESACLPGAVCRSMEKDHTGMNKFGPNDREYTEVLKPDLESCFRKADDVVQTRTMQQEYGSDSANPDLKLLHHQLMPVVSKLNDKLESIHREQQRMISHRPTCGWIEDLEMFQAWRASREFKVLWVHGKSGSGKSSLAAYITRLIQPNDTGTPPYDIPCELPITQAKCAAIDPGRSALYFLCGVEPASESPSRILGTLIHQLLLRYSSSNWKLQAIAVRATKKLETGGDIPGVAALLVELARLVGGTYIIIDGLEENPQYSECIKALALLSSPAIRVLLFSQNIYSVDQKLHLGFNEADLVDFDITAYTKADINTVAEVRTADLMQANTVLAGKQDDIVRILQDQADGSFQWVVASIMHLEQGTVRPSEVEKCLSSNHNGTAENYDKILEFVVKRAQSYDRDKIRAALMWLCGAAVPLRSSHLLTMIHLGEEDSDITLEKVEESQDSDKQAADRLKALLGSTMEIIASTDDSQQYYVRLCHASFKDYITDLKRPSLGDHAEALKDLKFSQTAAQKHCTAITMSICTASCLRLSQRARLAAQHALEDYAWRFWSYHFKLSQAELTDEDLRVPFNSMIKWVSGDMLAVLEGLGQFANSRFGVNEISRKRRLNFARSFQEAQRSLVTPIRGLIALRGELPVAEQLQIHRKGVQNMEDQLRDSAVPFVGNDTGITIVNLVTSSPAKLKSSVSKIGKVHLEQLLKDRSDNIPPSRLMITLAEIARGLRFAAAHFSVDPVYQELVRRSRRNELCLITMLTQVATLFDLVSSYPYWKDAPAFIDPDDVFETRDDDPYASHAVVVLQRILVTERTVFGKLVSSTEPLDLAEERVIRQPETGLTPTSWYIANSTYSMHGAPRNGAGRLMQTFVVNPLVNYQMRDAMYLDFDNASLLRDPRQNLVGYVPDEVRRNPVGTYIAAIPAMLPVVFVHYVKMLTQIADPFLWPILQWQWMRLQMALAKFRLFWHLLMDLKDPSGSTKLIHWIFGLALYFVRRRYFLWFGAHLSQHPWDDTVNAFQDPNRYFESTRYTWKQTLVYTASHGVGNAVFQGAYGYMILTRGEPRSSLFIPEMYVVFWALCILERGFCQGVNAGLYPFAVASLVIHTPGLLKIAVIFTIFYWIICLVGMLDAIMKLGLYQFFGGWGLALGFLSWVIYVWYMVKYSDRMVEYIWFALSPIRDLFAALGKGVLHAWIPLLEVLGVLVGGMTILCSLSMFSQLWDDPLDMQRPREDLRLATVAARGTLMEYSPFRIEGNGDQRPSVSPGSGVLRHARRNLSRSARKYLPRTKTE